MGWVKDRVVKTERFVNTVGSAWDDLIQACKDAVGEFNDTCETLGHARARLRILSENLFSVSYDKGHGGGAFANVDQLEVEFKHNEHVVNVRPPTRGSNYTFKIVPSDDGTAVLFLGTKLSATEASQKLLEKYLFR